MEQKMSNSRLKIKLKLLMLGDSNVGKAYWLKKIIGGKDSPHPPRREPHSAVDMATFLMESADHDYSFTFWNINPSERFKAVAEALYLKIQVDACIIFYNVNDRKSFENVDKHVARVKHMNPDARFVLLGTHFGGMAEITEEEAEKKAAQLGMRSFYGVNAKLDSNSRAFYHPLNYIVRNSSAAKIAVPSLNFQYCQDEIDRALWYCWNEERAALLREFKQQLNQFASFGTDVTIEQFGDMQRECNSIVTKAQIILDGAFPERLKMAAFAAATAVLLTTALVCGLAIFNVFTLPILTGLLIAGCAAFGTGGLISAFCCLFKARENIIYSFVVDTAKEAVREFPGIKQG